VVGPEDLVGPGVGRGEEEEVGDDGEDGEGADDAALPVEGEADDYGGQGEEERYEGEPLGEEAGEEDAHVEVGEEDRGGEVDAAEAPARALRQDGRRKRQAVMIWAEWFWLSLEGSVPFQLRATSGR